MLTPLQIKAITYDLNHSGITSPELRDDIFDHICCLVEKEMETEADFRTAYLKVRRKFGSLRAIQIKTDLEVESSKRFNAFIKICNYVFVSFYMFIGVLFVSLPVLVYLIEDSWFAIMVLPATLLGFVIIFTRIDYRRFDIIPFKEGFSPIKMTF